MLSGSPRFLLLFAATLLTVAGILLAQNEARLRRAIGLAEGLTLEMQAQDRSWEEWLDPWLEAWLTEHHPGDLSNRAALRDAAAGHLTRYAALSTHQNVVQGTRIQREQTRALTEFSAIVGKTDGAALLADLDNAWGRHFQGMAVLP